MTDKDITRDPFNRAVLGLDPSPPADDEVGAIRARHEAYKNAKADDAFYSSPNGYPPPSTNKIADVVHTDRATLLAALEAALAENVRLKEKLTEVYQAQRHVIKETK